MEASFAIALLMTAFVGVVVFIDTVSTHSRMMYAAHAAARSLAFDSKSDPWSAVWRELGGGTGVACPDWTGGGGRTECNGLSLDVSYGIAPARLSTPDAPGAGGNMVLVRIAESPADLDPPAEKSVVGLARIEPD